MPKSRIFLIAALVFLIASAGLVFFVKHKIGQKIEQGFADLEGASYESYEVHLLAGKISIKQIKLDTPLGALSASAEGQKVSGTVSEAYIDGLHWLDLVRENRLLASEIALRQPHLQFSEVPADSLSAEEVKETAEARAFFAEIKNLKIEEGDIAFYGKEAENPKLRLESFSLEFDKFTFDDALKNDKIALGGYNLNLGHLYLQAADGLHEMKLDSVFTQNRNVTLQNLTFKSPYETDAFMQKLTYRKAKFDLSVPEIILHDFPLERVFNNRFDIPLLSINGADLGVFVDKNNPLAPDKRGLLPGAALRAIESRINADSIAINDASVLFSLKEAGRSERGEIFFKNINARLENVTNDSTLIAKDRDLIAKINSKFMGTSNFDLTVRFFLDSPVYAYDFYGKLDTFDMRRTNRMLADVSQIKISRGDIKELTFEVSADDDRSTGTLDFLYENLEVELIDESGKKKSGVLNWLVQKVLIKEQNTPDGDRKRGEIGIPRDKRKGFFDQLWLSVLDGLKGVILPG